MYILYVVIHNIYSICDKLERVVYYAHTMHDVATR